jgi:hypothetical protein
MRPPRSSSRSTGWVASIPIFICGVGERKLGVQSVGTLHNRSVSFRDRSRQVMDAAAADTQNLRPLDDRQIVFAVDHRLALSRPVLVSAPSKEIVFERQLADLYVQRLQIDRQLRRSAAAAEAKSIRSSSLELRFPRGDLIGLAVELLR